MLKCNECGVVFPAPTEYKERHDEIPPPNVRFYNGCPRCGSPDYDPVCVCVECGDTVSDAADYIEFKNGDIVCNRCLHDYCKERYT